MIGILISWIAGTLGAIFRNTPEPENQTLVEIRLAEERLKKAQALADQNAAAARAAEKENLRKLREAQKLADEKAAAARAAEEERLRKLGEAQKLTEEKAAAARAAEESLKKLREAQELADKKAAAARDAEEERLRKLVKAQELADRKATAARAAEEERLRKLMEDHNRKMDEDRQARELAEREAQKIREEAKKTMEEARKAEEVARKLQEEAQVEAERAKEEGEKAKEEAEKIKSEAEAREAEALRREKAAVEALEKGIAPVKRPTIQEIDAAKAAISYNPELLHFAICGTSGSGKSTLINALRGLGDEAKSAAAVGIVETTSTVTRYPDARSEYPYSRFVWYDIPGAGTLNVPDWQYFIDQGLFVFDFIVMTYDVRFTKIDLGILEHCHRFRIPVFVVRSKADQHIRNMAKSAKYDEDEEPYKPWYEKLKPKFVSDTRSDFVRNLQGSVIAKQNKQDHPLDEMLYIISSPILRELTTPREDEKLKDKHRYKIIDEENLIMDMFKVAALRRYKDVDNSVSESGKKFWKKMAGLGAKPKETELAATKLYEWD